MFNNSYYINNIGPLVSDDVYMDLMSDGYRLRLFKRMISLKKKDREKLRDEERKLQLELVVKARLESDKEIIKNHILTEVRLDMAKNYDYHEIMTHYFLGLDDKERPFDIDRYGIPYYLDLETLQYKYYVPTELNARVLKYSDAKRKRLGLPSLVKTPLKNWVYGETLDNSPYNMDNILKDEIEIRSRLDQYRDTVTVTNQYFENESTSLKSVDFEYEF